MLTIASLFVLPAAVGFSLGGPAAAPRSVARAARSAAPVQMGYNLDLSGKVAFVAGVADSTGYGWAIAKALAEAGATVTVGTWPPVLAIFEKSLKAVRRAAVATALQFLADTPRNSFRHRESLTRT